MMRHDNDIKFCSRNPLKRLFDLLNFIVCIHSGGFPVGYKAECQSVANLVVWELNLMKFRENLVIRIF